MRRRARSHRRSEEAEQQRPAGRGGAVLAAVAGALIVLLLVPATAHSQKVEVKNKSTIRARGIRLQDTFTLSSKGWSVGWTNTLAAGRPLDNVFSARYDIAPSTKVWFHTSMRGLSTEWETKVNHKVGKLLDLDAGFGSDGLFHTGVRYGQKRKKGFGFEAAYVRQPRGTDASFGVWHTIDALALTATFERRRGRFGWSVTSDDFLRGALRFESTTTRDGQATLHQVVWGRGLRDGSFQLDREPFDFFPDDQIFGDDALKVKSPLVEDEPELAWMVRDYGGRLQETNTTGGRKVSAEAVRYLSDSLWIGGVWSVKNGEQEGLDFKFGSTAETLDLATTVGYSISKHDVSGAVNLRWRPGR